MDMVPIQSLPRGVVHLVEDDEQTREATARFLRAAGHIVGLREPGGPGDVDEPRAVRSAGVGDAGASRREGTGFETPDPTFGGMLDEGRQFLLVAPHLVVFPGLALAGTVLMFQLLGDALRDLLDVRHEGA